MQSATVYKKAMHALAVIPILLVFAGCCGSRPIIADPASLLSPNIADSLKPETVVIIEPDGPRRPSTPARIPDHQPRKPAIRVPNLVGLTLDSAKTLLRQKKLITGRIVVMRHSGKPGLILAQKPPYGQQLPIREGSAVDLTVSVPVIADIPDVTGKSLYEARSAIENAGFAIGTVRPDSLGAEATVAGQSPTPGKRMEKGTAIDLRLKPADASLPPVNPELLTIGLLAAGGGALLWNRMRKQSYPGKKREAAAVTPRMDYGNQEFRAPSGLTGKHDASIGFLHDIGVQEIRFRKPPAITSD
jgi:hypothetical protein